MRLRQLTQVDCASWRGALTVIGERQPFGYREGCETCIRVDTFNVKSRAGIGVEVGVPLGSGPVPVVLPV